jgi:hypothetical protein
MSIPKAPIKIKLTGDTHLPDVESDLDIEEGTSSLAKLAQPRDRGGRPVVRHAGVMVAPEADTDLDATAGARDAGTSRRTLSRGGGTRRDAPGEGARRGAVRLRRQERQPATTAQPRMVARSATGVWIAALTAAVLLVRLMR